MKKEVIALQALIKTDGDVGKAKAIVTIRISARTWQKAINQFRGGWEKTEHIVFDQLTSPE